MNDNKTLINDESHFASISLLNGKEVKIYGFMPALDLKQLSEHYQILSQDNPDMEIPDVYN